MDVPNNKIGVHILNTQELDKASMLINSNGGSWGYVTIPIQPTDRDKPKWEAFMQKASDLEVIPILRITNIPLGGTWAAGGDTDLVDFANFLDELPWPTENRFVIIFNEVNRASEWGGSVNPAKYAQILINANLIFKERSEDFFILPAGLDAALPNSSSSLNITEFLSQMQQYDQNIWSYIDGWSSHSYPNPGFAASPHNTGLTSILGYKNELILAGITDKPVFITETGWDKTRFGSYDLKVNYLVALNKWLDDDRVVAITPFILQASGPFTKFSLLSENGDPESSWEAMNSISKTKGEPRFRTKSSKQAKTFSLFGSNPTYSSSNIMLRIENFLRSIFNLPLKQAILINNTNITVEVAKTPNQLSKGLSSRSRLADNHGMLFIFDTPHIPEFWMKDMRFDLDMIWIKDNAVIDITHNVPKATSPPYPTYSPSEEVDMILEVSAGWSKDHKIEIGNSVDILYLEGLE